MKLSIFSLSRCTSIGSKYTTFTKSDLRVALGFPPLATCVADSSESVGTKVLWNDNEITGCFYGSSHFNRIFYIVNSDSKPFA